MCGGPWCWSMECVFLSLESGVGLSSGVHSVAKGSLVCVCEGWGEHVKCKLLPLL